MADEPESIEELVVRIIREQLAAGEWEPLIEALQRMGAHLPPQVGREASLAGHGELRAKVAPATAAIVGAVESAYPQFANIVRGRTSREGTTVSEILKQILEMVFIAVSIYMVVHPQPTHAEIAEIHQIIKQTIYIVINMPPPGHS